MTNIEMIKVLEEKKVRKVWDEVQEQWYVSIVNIIEIFTGSDRPGKYWSNHKQKLKAKGSELSDKIGQLKMCAEDSKMRYTDCRYSATFQINAIHATNLRHSGGCWNQEKNNQIRCSMTSHIIPATEALNHLVVELKQRIREFQYRALQSANKQLTALYYAIAQRIVESQETHGWEKSIIAQLVAEGPEIEQKLSELFATEQETGDKDK